MIRIKKALAVWLCLGALILQSHGQALSEPNGNQAPFVANRAGEFDGHFKRRKTPPPAARSMKTGMLIAGTISLLGLGAIGAGGLVRHSKMAGARRFRFPPVDRPERLEAPCGGSVTARRFAPPAPRAP